MLLDKLLQDGMQGAAMDARVVQQTNENVRCIRRAQQGHLIELDDELVAVQ
jgi:hypothetical protein